MTAQEIILLVVAILAFQAVAWIPVIVWLKRKSASLMPQLRDEITASGESLVRGPERASYDRGTHGYSKIAGSGAIALSNRRLLFRKIVGSGFEIALDQITGVREDKWFLKSYRGGRLHLIVQVQGGAEVGFTMAPDHHAAWMQALRAR